MMTMRLKFRIKEFGLDLKSKFCVPNAYLAW